MAFHLRIPHLDEIQANLVAPCIPAAPCVVLRGRWIGDQAHPYWRGTHAPVRLRPRSRRKSGALRVEQTSQYSAQCCGLKQVCRMAATSLKLGMRRQLRNGKYRRSQECAQWKSSRESYWGPMSLCLIPKSMN